MYGVYLRDKRCSFKYIGKRLLLVHKQKDHDVFHCITEALEMIKHFNGHLKFEIREIKDATV